MAKHLNDKNIKDIREMLDGWNGPLTWQSLIDGIKGLTGQTYTRQTLHSHEPIRLAYSVRRNIIKDRPEVAPRGSVEV